MLGLAAKKAEELDSKYGAASFDREDYCEAKISATRLLLF
jgi:hypothetical protein